MRLCVAVYSAHMNSEAPRVIPILSAALQDRIKDPRTGEGAQRRAAEIQAALGRPEVHARRAGLLRVATDPRSSTDARYAALRQLADLFVEAAKGIAPCRSGCTHCCHIPVAMAPSEARVIARATGRALSKRGVKLAARGVGRTEYGYETPCPFLKEGGCSIYAVRPIACRALISLDGDDLLCRLVPGASIQVPYLNLSDLQMLLATLALGEGLADIRDFFP